MTDPQDILPSERVAVTTKIGFRIDHLQKGKYTFLLPLDPEVATLIGQIAVYWGAFEVRMDALIESLSKRNGTQPQEGWRLQSFKKRRDLFKKEISQYTQSQFEGVARFSELHAPFMALCANSGDLHWQRNILAHGYYEIKPRQMPNVNPSYYFVAHGKVKGQIRTILIDVPTLSKLWHDVAHILGDLMVLVNRMGGRINEWDQVVPDEDLLRDEPHGTVRTLDLSPESQRSHRIDES